MDLNKLKACWTSIQVTSAYKLTARNYNLLHIIVWVNDILSPALTLALRRSIESFPLGFY